MVKILVNIEYNFGHDRIFPANEAAEILLRIAGREYRDTGRKTLHIETLEDAYLLGLYTVVADADKTRFKGRKKTLERLEKLRPPEEA